VGEVSRFGLLVHASADEAEGSAANGGLGQGGAGDDGGAAAPRPAPTTTVGLSVEVGSYMLSLPLASSSPPRGGPTGCGEGKPAAAGLTPLLIAWHQRCPPPSATDEAGDDARGTSGATATARGGGGGGGGVGLGLAVGPDGLGRTSPDARVILSTGAADQRRPAAVQPNADETDGGGAARAPPPPLFALRVRLEEVAPEASVWIGGAGPRLSRSRCERSSLSRGTVDRRRIRTHPLSIRRYPQIGSAQPPIRHY
jgi:hypothetical protein